MAFRPTAEKSENSSIHLQRTAAAGFAAAVAFGLTQSALAAAPTQDADYLRPGGIRSIAELTVGATHSDNVRRLPTNEVSDTIATVGMLINTRRDGTRLDYSVAGDVNWLDYIDNTYRSEFYGVLDGTAKFGIVPGRFDWNLRESYNRLLIDPVGAATPDNIERFNYVTTGPRVAVLLGTATELSLDATYSKVTTHDQAGITNTQTALDSDRYGAALTLARAVSESSKLSAGVTSEKIEYDVSPDSDYRRDQASVLYVTRVARTAFTAEVGATRIDQRDDTSTGLLARFGITRKVSASSTVTLGLARQTADSADIIRAGTGAQRPEDAPITIAARDPFVDKTVSLGWDYERGRNRFGIDGFHSEQTYTLSSSRARKLKGGGAYFERRLRPTLSFNLAGRYQEEDLEGLGAGSKDSEAIMGFTWQAGPRTSVSLQGERYKRSGSGLTSDYTDNRIGLRFGYNLLRATGGG